MPKKSKQPAPTVRFTPRAQHEVRVPKGFALSGYRYRTLNRRMEVVLTEKGLIHIKTRRLLDAESLAYHQALPETRTRYLTGRVLIQHIFLSPEAVCALGHFAERLQTAVPAAQTVTALHS